MQNFIVTFATDVISSKPHENECRNKNGAQGLLNLTLERGQNCYI